MRSTLLALCFVLATPWLASPPAAAQVRRCVDAQGHSVYTDRACSAVDAAPKEAPVPHAGAYASGFASRGCARSSQALLDGVRGALEARDVNRLANYYHWTGTGSGAARHLMDSLEAVAKRPLVSVELEYPAVAFEDPQPTLPTMPTRAAAPAPARRLAWPPAPAPLPAPDTALADAEAAPAPEAGAPPPSAPEGLLVQQMSGDSDAGSSRTRFQLRRNAGCWWIEL